MYVWGLRKNEVFDSWGDVFAAWLQNLLGNVITMQKLHDKIKASEEVENYRESWYWYGRFWTLFINFDPIPEDSFDDSQFDDRNGGGLPRDDFPPEDLFSTLPALLRNSHINADDARLLTSSPLVEHPRVRGFFGSALGFAAGYINASLGNASPNSGICQTNLTRIVESSENFYHEVTEASEDSLKSAVVSATDVLASVHPIAFSCYYSVAEFGDAGDYYLLTLQDAGLLSYNIIHEGGKLYDTIYFLAKHQKRYSEVHETGTEEEQEDWWYKLGIYYGTVTFLIFYSPPNVDPFDPLEQY